MRNIAKQNVLPRKVTMTDIELKIKDKRSKWKKLNKISFSIPTSKVSSKMSLEGSNSLIQRSGANQHRHQIQKKCT